MQRMASTRWHVNAVCLLQIGVQVVTTRGCKALCDSYFRVALKAGSTVLVKVTVGLIENL